MSPPFFFRIDDMQENPEHIPCVDRSGRWYPPRSVGGNKLIGGNDSGKYWHCTGNFIIPAEGNKPPQGCYHFKTFSVYYDHGTFWITRGDASTNLIGAGDSNKESGTGHGEDWRCLTFDYDGPTYASRLTNAGENSRLRTQRPDQDWPRMLLPEHYHAPSSSHTEYEQYGGLIGELPLFLALIAFSVEPNHVGWALQTCFQDQSWSTHNVEHVRQDGRGMVVRVYCSPGSDATELESYENGDLGKYFN